VLRKAIALQANYPEAHNNLGIVLVQAGKHEDGLQHYDEALRLRPDYPEAHMNRSLSWLAMGNFEQGWPEYEWRLRLRQPQDKEPAPRWEGQRFDNQTLLLSAEQGLGDCLQFLRYAKAAKARGGTVVFDCPPPLLALAKTCPGLDLVVPRGEPLPVADWHCPLLSLPKLLGSAGSEGLATPPYYQVDPTRIAHWKSVLGPSEKLRVGIAWQGSTAHKGDHLRSVPLTRFAPLAALPGVQLVSFQKGFGSEQLAAAKADGLDILDILDLGAQIDTDMIDAGAALHAIDLFVTVDTALAHLAGAMGRTVWVATPFAADWRWLRQREDTPWYPSMTLFRQRHRHDWDHVFGRIAARLVSFAKQPMSLYGQ
jgi:Tetratricopeptide repeat